MSDNASNPSGAVAANLEYYDQTSEGTTDYWNLMAAPRWRVDTLRELLGRDAPKQVVDLGCGNGALLEAVGSAIPGSVRVGIDLSPGRIEMNKREKPDIEWHVGDLGNESAKLPKGTEGRFDAVLATEIIEHLDDPFTFLKIALKLAAPAGRIYLSTQSGPVHETEKRVGHVQHFSADNIRSMLLTTGWRPERAWNGGFPFHDLSKKVANLNPDGMMQAFSGKKYGLKERLTCALLRGAFRFNSKNSGYQLFAVGRKPT